MQAVTLSANARSRVARDSGWREHDAARGHAEILARNIEPQAPFAPHERITQRTERRLQMLDRNAVAVQPRCRHAGRDHERMIRFALVRKEIEHRADEVRCHPAVRHVADEA